MIKFLKDKLQQLTIDNNFSKYKQNDNLKNINYSLEKKIRYFC